jgi:hypothetical protein
MNRILLILCMNVLFPSSVLIGEPSNKHTGRRTLLAVFVFLGGGGLLSDTEGAGIA